MHPSYLNDYELAKEKSLHPASDEEKRLADAYLALYDRLQHIERYAPFSR